MIDEFDDDRLHPIRFLRLPEVLDRVGVSHITLWRWEKGGLFPKRRKIGPKLVAWVDAEINEWCAQRAVVEIQEEGE